MTSVDSYILETFAKTILKEENVITNYGKSDIQRSVNGGKERVGAEELDVITSMLLLLVMMDCKNCYNDERCVVHHIVNNSEFFLSLNCEDWIRNKALNVRPGWSIFDHNGE